jgi:hypothetical protein
MANEGPSKRAVIDALVLAFSHSRAKELVGTDALRSVLDVEYSELTASGAFALQGVWELLQQQPGFEQAAAIPPLCAFKQWERRLGIEVRMPEDLSHYDEIETRRQASDCRVPAAELSAVVDKPETSPATESVNKPGQATKRVSKARVDTSRSGFHKRPAKPALPPARRRAIIALASAIALASFAFVGVTAYRGCSPEAEWHDFEASAFAGDLPIRDARRLGKRVGARLSDPHWLEGPAAMREQQLADAFKVLERRKIVMLFLTDDRDHIVASVQRDGNGKLRYAFR